MRVLQEKPIIPNELRDGFRISLPLPVFIDPHRRGIESRTLDRFYPLLDGLRYPIPVEYSYHVPFISSHLKQSSGNQLLLIGSFAIFHINDEYYYRLF